MKKSWHVTPVSLAVYTSLSVICNESLVWFEALILDPHWTRVGYPFVVLCHGDSIVLDLQVRPFHMLKQFID